MDSIKRLINKVSFKAIATHIFALVFAMSIIWGVSYLILVTFSIQETKVAEPDIATINLKVASTTASSTSKNKAMGTSSKATSTKPKR